MSNVRLYEFAKQQNMDSEELLRLLRAKGMDFPNTMVILDEATQKKAREILYGIASPKGAQVEETRINPGVIRRRKLRSEAEGLLTEEAPSEKKPPEEAPLEIKPEEEQKEALEDTKEISEEKEVGLKEDIQKAPQQVPVETQEEGRDQVTRPEKAIEGKKKAKVKPFKHKKRPKKKFDEPARIIKRPEPEPPKEPELVQQEQKVEPLGAQVPEARVAEEVVQEPQPELQPTEKEPLAEVTEERIEERLEEEIFAIEDQGKIFPVEAIPVLEPLRPLKKKKEKKKELPEEKEPLRLIKKVKKMEIYERDDLYEGKMRIRKEKKKEKKAPVIPIQKEVPKTPPEPKPEQEIKVGKKKVKMGETIILGDLAKAMGIKASELIKKLLEMGTLATINQALDYETAALLADEYGCEVEQVTFKEEEILQEEPDREEDLKPRPPVVTVMGHVDHGKTTLLDYIRKTKVAEAESGGITQHIGAYYVKTDQGGVVFLDTPGHEAFTAMRARGAKVTDIIVLVVAADDGVMPQTKEAINHARAANIPIVVAINKIDKPNANPERVKRQLAELGLIPEEWGGDVIFGNISAKTGQGVDELLGLILLQAEILELKANPNKRAKGFIIEARLDKTKGPVATVLVKEGTLKVGDYFVAGEVAGRVRAMFDHKGVKLKTAGPSIPVELYGMPEVPNAGDELVVTPDEKTAKTLAEHRKSKAREREAIKARPVSMEEFMEKIRQGEAKELNVVLRADVQGSLEAISDSLGKLMKGEIKVKVIHSGTGAITESDVMLASASNAIILGFNVRANPRVKELAEKEKVQIRYYDVIYNLLEDMEKALEGMLEPVYEEKSLGQVEVLQTFKIPKVGVVAGCIVRSGIARRNAKVRVIRDGVVIHEGVIASLKRFKEDVREVQEGMECGIGLDRFQDIKVGDIFEVYALEEVSQ